MSQRVMITGASGLFGANALLAGRDRHEIVGIFHQNPIRMPGVTTRGFDLTSDDLPALIAEVDPQVVIHAAAETNVDRCETDPVAATQLNVQIPQRIAQACADQGRYLIHVSTDAFFEGSDRPFTEEDAPHPLSVYGETKLEGERAVLEAHPSSLVARTNFYGWNAQDKQSLGEWILGSLRSGTPTTLFRDVVFCPIYAPILASILFDLIELRPSGILHVVGGDPLTKLDFGERICRLFELDPACIVPVDVADAALAARRSTGMALSVDKLRSLLPGVDLGVDAGLAMFRANETDGWRQALKDACRVESPGDER